MIRISLLSHFNPVAATDFPHTFQSKPATFPLSVSGRRPCACCGYLTVDQEERGGSTICEVCGWMTLSEAEGDHWDWSLPPLSEAVALFETTGTCDPALVGSVRSPRPAEIPPGGWLPWKERRNQEIDETLIRIYDAFCQVSLGDGVGLHDARVLDDFWGMNPPEEYLRELRIDTAGHWADTDPGLLEHYGEFFSFTDQIGFRYYAPAYATAWLRSVRSDGARTFCCGQLVRFLADPNGHMFSILTREQTMAMAAFLRTFARYSPEHEAKDARYALSAWWSQGGG